MWLHSAIPKSVVHNFKGVGWGKERAGGGGGRFNLPSSSLPPLLSTLRTTKTTGTGRGKVFLFFFLAAKPPPPPPPTSRVEKKGKEGKEKNLQFRFRGGKREFAAPPPQQPAFRKVFEKKSLVRLCFGSSVSFFFPRGKMMHFGVHLEKGV